MSTHSLMLTVDFTLQAARFGELLHKQHATAARAMHHWCFKILMAMGDVLDLYLSTEGCVGIGTLIWDVLHEI